MLLDVIICLFDVYWIFIICLFDVYLLFYVIALDVFIGFYYMVIQTISAQTDAQNMSCADRCAVVYSNHAQTISVKKKHVMTTIRCYCFSTITPSNNEIDRRLTGKKLECL